MLLFVHGGIGLSEYPLNITAVVDICGDYADAERERVSAAWVCVALIQFVLHTPLDSIDILLICIGYKDGEFVAANASQNIALSK